MFPRAHVLKMATYNVHPSGAHMGHPKGAPLMGALMGTHMHPTGALEPETSRRRVDVRPRKENNVHPVGVHIWGTLKVPH